MGIRSAWWSFQETFGQVFKLTLFAIDIIIVIPAMFAFAVSPIALAFKMAYMGLYFVATQSPIWIGIYRKLQHEKMLALSEAWESQKSTEQLMQEYRKLLKR